MPNFCPNCGNRLTPGSKFCPSCGGRVGTGSGVIGQWEVKEEDADSGVYRRGFLVLTETELIYLSKPGLFSKKQKEYCRIPLSQIKRVQKTPLFNLVSISYNRVSSDAGTLKKFFGKRQLGFRMKNSKLFIEKLKALNPNIKA